MTDEEIDFIAADGMRNALGGIYSTRVYEFARAIEQATARSCAEKVQTKADEWAALAKESIEEYESEDKSDPRNAVAFKDHDFCRARFHELNDLAEAIRAEYGIE